MILIRRFEELISELFKQGKIKGTLHLSTGQEAIPVGVCCNLTKKDIVTASHRTHHIIIAKGLETKKLLSEIMGKEDGFCRGYSGSMHIFSKKDNFFGSNGIVSANIALSAGMALAIKKKNEEGIVVTFFGEGAITEGIFHETINMAVLMELPIIFICENNLYAQSTPINKQSNVKNLVDRIKPAYNIESTTVDGNNIFEIKEIFKKITSYVRNNKKPFFVEFSTYRFCGHSIKDKEQTYRDVKEIKDWMKKDPISLLKKNLLDRRILTKIQVQEIESEINKELEEAISFANNSKDSSLKWFGDKNENLVY